MFKNIDLRKNFMLVIALGFITPLLASPDDFTFNVDTRLGTGATFTIPTYGTGYNYDVDCNTDGSYEATGQTGNYTCDYSSMGGSGVYTIQIKDAIGDGTGFPRVRFNDLGEANEIIELSKWGTGVWDSMEGALKVPLIWK